MAKSPACRVWIADDTHGWWQMVEYQGWPKYCSFCTRIGHSEVECFKKNPSLKPLRAVSSGRRAENLVYMSKETGVDAKGHEVSQTAASKDKALKEG